MMTCQSSGLQSASAAIVARPCRLHGITLRQAGAASTVIVYDNKSAAAGTVVDQLNNNTNTSTASTNYSTPVECLNGIYVAVTGTDAAYIIHYSLL